MAARNRCEKAIRTPGTREAPWVRAELMLRITLFLNSRVRKALS